LKALHLEPGVRVSGRLAADLRRAIQRCADWHGTPEVQITSAPPELLEALAAQESVEA
jgi:uncharacterized protein YcaQ